MKRKSRREFLQDTAVGVAVGTLAGVSGCAPSKPTEIKLPEKPSMIDFDRSYFTWTSQPYVPHPHYVNDGGMVQGAGSVRDVRILYEAKCDITNHSTGHVEELFLLHPCLSEYTIPQRDFFTLPSREFRVIFSRTHAIPIAKLPSNVVEAVEPRPHKFASTRFTTRAHSRFTRLSSAQEVIEAALMGKPLNVRTTHRDDARGYTLSLEYPVRTINLNVEEGLFQIDTGPTPLPDMNGWDGTRPKRAFLTFVASSGFDFAEFILRREVEPSEEDKKWLFQLRGKWRWELRAPKNPPPGHPPRPPWPTTYNETLRLNTTNEFFCAEI